jgi:hypothetical protein
MAAATPSFTSRVIRISDCEIDGTFLLYADHQIFEANQSASPGRYRESNLREHKNV